MRSARRKRRAGGWPVADRSAIEWTDATWNPVVGCTQVSPGCAHCYAKSLHDQRHRAYKEGKLQQIPQYAKPFEEVQLIPERLSAPLRWRDPRRIFVNSMSDLFHEEVPAAFVAAVFGVMAMAQQHTFQVLTKRPERMHAWLTDPRTTLGSCLLAATRHHLPPGVFRADVVEKLSETVRWPLPNVWLGVSVENQRMTWRAMELAGIPAAVRFISAEPLLGPVDLRALIEPFETDRVSRTESPIHWIIAGAESGPGARPMDEEWVRSLRDQCQEADVAFFYKQAVRGGRVVSLPELDGARWAEFPENVFAR